LQKGGGTRKEYFEKSLVSRKRRWEGELPQRNLGSKVRVREALS